MLLHQGCLFFNIFFNLNQGIKCLAVNAPILHVGKIHIYIYIYIYFSDFGPTSEGLLEISELPFNVLMHLNTTIMQLLLKFILALGSE